MKSVNCGQIQTHSVMNVSYCKHHLLVAKIFWGYEMNGHTMPSQKQKRWHIYLKKGTNVKKFYQQKKEYINSKVFFFFAQSTLESQMCNIQFVDMYKVI